MKVKATLAAATTILAVFAMFNGVASAHHGRAGYGTETKTVRGVVTEVRWVNPHVFLMFDVKDQSAKAVSWTGEFSSVATMLSEGMTKGSCKPGDEVIVTGTVAASGEPHSLVIKIQKADGSSSLDLSARRGVQ